jgi:hypothetical protein
MTKYCEYFEVDDKYFPCIDDSAINAGVDWTKTYPHETFVKLLRNVESMLSRTNGKRSVWIEGAYGTGKSRCAYTLKKILDVSEEELRTYWERYDALKKLPDLLNKLLGHKAKKIVTAHRYASGGIYSTRDLLLAVQDSIKTALISANVDYLGEKTLKDSVIAWLEDPLNKSHFNDYLNLPEWANRFSQNSADEVLKSLKENGEIKELMDNIFRLADARGITALSIDTDGLISWLKDIIERNDIRIVLVWDEFSAYFKNNRNSLDEFQKLASLCQEAPFYFIVITHETGSLIVETDSSWKIVRNRFEFTEITLPDNIAVELIAHAFDVKEAAKADWEKLADDLNGQLTDSRKVVAAAANISDPNLMKRIMPLHPMAALVLKNIASAFQSNQRSMFDFIKNEKEDDVQSFQWFISNKGPKELDGKRLLTVDMLWNFFYEKGRGNLAADIRAILDTYPRQKDLKENEQAVLKAILIMQAIDQRLGGKTEIFKTTEKNLSYVFEGIPDLEGSAAGNIAKKLEREKVLSSYPIGNSTRVYVTTAIAGDQTQIDNLKEDLRKEKKTYKLVTEGGIENVLSLGAALKERFNITPVTVEDFTKTINGLRNRNEASWKFQAVIAFAKDDAEVDSLRKLMKVAVLDKSYENITFIDALFSPLGKEDFEAYIDFAATAKYYITKEKGLAGEQSRKATDVLEKDWKNRIYNGQFVVYSYTNTHGDRYPNGQSVVGALRDIVTRRFPDAYDFKQGLTETMLRCATNFLSNGAKSGITQTTASGFAGIEKAVTSGAWKVDKYWDNNPQLSISKMKISVEQAIGVAFKKDGRISIREIFNLLQNEYGLTPSGLSAFVTGFLLKEYASDPYRFSDVNGDNEPMTSEKLIEMIKNYIGMLITPKSYKDTYIVKMTPDEIAFFNLTEKAFRIPTTKISSAEQAARLISAEMRKLGFPIWCLSEIDEYGVSSVIEKYTDLVRQENSKDISRVALEIGRMASAKPTLGDNLAILVTRENCGRAMRELLSHFEDGKIIELAKSISAENSILDDVHKLFEAKYSCFWDRETGEDEIRKLIIMYQIVAKSNQILSSKSSSLAKCFSQWRDRLKFLKVSHEALKNELPESAKLWGLLREIAEQNDLSERWSSFLSELNSSGSSIHNFLNNQREIFAKIYKPYLDGLSNNDIAGIISKLQTGMFMLTKTECNSIVSTQAEAYRQALKKTRLRNLWREKTGTKNPSEWSNRYKTPILCLVSGEEFESAKKTFDTLNRSNPGESEINVAITFLESAKFISDLNDDGKRNEAFKREIIGEYYTLISDVEKVRDHLDRLSIEPYDWYGNPNVKKAVEALAKAQYDAGGSDRALQTIDDMDGAKLKEYLKRLVIENMAVGIEIILTGGK